MGGSVHQCKRLTTKHKDWRSIIVELGDELSNSSRMGDKTLPPISYHLKLHEISQKGLYYGVYTADSGDCYPAYACAAKISLSSNQSPDLKM